MTTQHLNLPSPDGPSPSRRSPVHRVKGAATRLRATIGIPGGLALAVILLTQILGMAMETVLDSPREVLLALVAAAVAVLLLAGRWLRALPAPASNSDFGLNGTDRLPTRRGAVILLGLDSAHPGSDTARLLTQLPAVEYLALIGNEATLERGVSDRVTGPLLTSIGVSLPETHVRRWEFGNAESVADAEQATDEAIRWLLGRGLDRSEVVLDVSSGRRAMAYGAKDAADEHQVETQYLASAWDSFTNAPIPGTQTFKVIRTFD